jgi:NAD(P)-dependent dehydrogenase (short-subunit alcohol dehydrogenase family)
MENKKFLIIGGSSGIGLEITKELANQGHHVFVASRSSDKIPNSNNIYHIKFDVASEDLPTDELSESLDGLAYCPGTINLKPFSQIKKENLDHDLKINFNGAVHSIQSTFSRLRKSSGTASIVLFSTVAVQTGMPYHASIASAKGAVEGLTRSLAAEFAPNICVNCIAPSLTNTPLAERLLSSEEKQKASNERHPLKRFGEPEDIASLACFLLNDNASWMTGQILHVDGGISSVKLF